jgi:uncharacterized membrane protein YkoI
MKNLTVGAIVISVLALVLSIVALVPAAPEEEQDSGQDPRCAEAVDQLAAKVASLEEGIALLESSQRAIATQLAERTSAAAKSSAPGLAPGELEKLIDERMRDAVLRSTGKARLEPEQIPEAVSAAAKGILGGGKIVRAELRQRHGRTEYRLKAALGGEQYDLKLLPTGEVLEAEMPPGREPEPVRTAAAAAVRGIKIEQVVLEFDKDVGGQVYDVEGRAGGANYDMIVTPEGHVVEIDGPGGKTRFPLKPAAGGAAQGENAVF